MKRLTILTSCLALVIPVLNAQQQAPALPAPPSTPQVVSSANPGPVEKPSPSANASPSSSNVDYLKAFADANVSSLKIAQQNHANETLLGAMGLLIPILVPLGSFAMVAVIVWLGVAARERQRRITHETIRLMVEKGQPVPPELFLDPKIAKPRNDMRRGIMLVAVGLGFAVFCLASHYSFWSLGVIPLLMGIGYIVVWKIEAEKKNNDTPSQP
jgi:Domain of unknown function (DUF6249)